MNITLNTFVATAQQALQNGPSGADTVLHVAGDERLDGHEWRSVLSRSRDFKEANTVARQALVDALCAEFGAVDFNNLPEKVKNVLKVNDFAFDAEGKVTSQRPLTARRIVNIATVLKSLNAEEKAKLATLGTETFGPHITVLDKVAVAREMARPQTGRFQEPAPVKKYHAMIALDMVEDVLANSRIKFPTRGTSAQRLDRLATDLSKFLGAKMQRIVAESVVYKGVGEMPPSVARYGHHTIGVQDMFDIASCILEVLAARNPEMRGVLASLDRAVFDEIVGAAGAKRDELACKVSDLVDKAERLFKAGKEEAARAKAHEAEKLAPERDVISMKFGLLAWIYEMHDRATRQA